MMVVGRRAVEGVNEYKILRASKMKVTVLELKPKSAVIDIQDAPVYIINSIRRIMLADLPKLAIEDVIIYDNTSPLFDEIIAHRLSMIPIPTDLDILTFRETCVCGGEGCPNCTVRYTLSKEGEGTVYSGDLQPVDSRWAIKEDKIPIVKLYGDQRLILEAEAILGRGRDHAKWQAVVAPRYRFIPEITVDPKRIEDAKEFIETLPEKLVTLKDNKLELSDLKKLPVLESYIEKNDIDFITIKYETGDLRFSFETDGSLTAEDALIHSIKILEEKFEEFNDHIEKLKK